MINPDAITKYDNTTSELEEVLLFWVCVANKNAKTIAKALEKFLTNIDPQRKQSPFAAIRKQNKEKLPALLKAAGIGQYNQKTRTIWELVNSNLDLHHCSVDELETIPGIGMKTSRCYLMHSRRNVPHAGIDTHIKKYLRELGHDVPNTLNKKQYLKYEQLFVTDARKHKRTTADHDLQIWLTYRIA